MSMDRRWREHFHGNILLERRQRLTSREPAAMSVAVTSQATAETRRVREQFLLNARFF